MSVKEIESQIKDLTRQLNEAKLGEYESMVGKCYEEGGEESSTYYFVRRAMSTGYLLCFYIDRCFDGEITVNPSYVVQPQSHWYQVPKEHFQDIWKRTSGLDPFKI